MQYFSAMTGAPATSVIPAQAGIQAAAALLGVRLDSRFRGNDEVRLAK
jgi:hypothetical protein